MQFRSFLYNSHHLWQLHHHGCYRQWPLKTVRYQFSENLLIHNDWNPVVSQNSSDICGDLVRQLLHMFYWFSGPTVPAIYYWISASILHFSQFRYYWTLLFQQHQQQLILIQERFFWSVKPCVHLQCFTDLWGTRKQETWTWTEVFH